MGDEKSGDRKLEMMGLWSSLFHELLCVVHL
jgi:hypothetical protein